MGSHQAQLHSINCSLLKSAFVVQQHERFAKKGLEKIDSLTSWCSILAAAGPAEAEM